MLAVFKPRHLFVADSWTYLITLVTRNDSSKAVLLEFLHRS